MCEMPFFMGWGGGNEFYAIMMGIENNINLKWHTFEIDCELDFSFVLN